MVICAKLTLPHDQVMRQRWWSRALDATSPQEHARAAAFLHDADGLRHLAGRALLRSLATRYAGMPHATLLRQQHHGKPSFAGVDFDVNLSHAGDQVWAALARVGQVGIDVEADPGRDVLQEVAQSFHGSEVTALSRLADPAAATLRTWTRKESVAKATGLGLSLPLDDYAVAVDDRVSQWLMLPPWGTQSAAWTTLDLPSSTGYSVSLALHKGQGPVVCMQWEDAV